MNLKKIIVWVIAIVITFAAAIYQRMTGPTYPKKEVVKVADTKHEFKFLRSHGGQTDAPIVLSINDSSISGTLYYKHYPVVADEPWTSIAFERVQHAEKSQLTVSLPNQPPAGKLIYYAKLKQNEQIIWENTNSPIVIRFKGAVPQWVLAPHVLFMFLGMLWANAAGLLAVFKLPFKRNTTITLVLIGIGGMILGPVVQKFAFLEYWAGIPFGWDLTDNKLLIAFIMWVLAFFANRQQENRLVTIAASVVTLIIFSIPHSMYGSELNRETGEIIQGAILIVF